MGLEVPLEVPQDPINETVFRMSFEEEVLITLCYLNTIKGKHSPNGY